MPWYSRENQQIRQHNIFHFIYLYIPVVLPFSYKLKLKKDTKPEAQKQETPKNKATLSYVLSYAL